MLDLNFRAQLLGAVFVLVTTAAHADLRERQDEAVFMARDGDVEQALDLLAQLRIEYPDEMVIRYDQAVIAAWDGRDQQALDIAADLEQSKTPAWVATAIGKSARNLQQFAAAIAWYEIAVADEPSNMDARLGLSMALADAGRHADARAALKQTPAETHTTVPVLMTSAYLFQREAMYIPAVNEYDRILRQEPANQQAIEGKIIALQALLLPAEALKIALAHPGTLNDAEIARLEGDAAGLELRRAMETPNQVYPYTRINLALAHIDERLEREPPGTRLAMQLRYDRIVGRTEAFRTLEAIADYEEMLAQGIDPPAYVHYAAGRSYLQRKRPDEALVALEKAEQLAPDDLEIQIEKFYALINLERHAEALALADSLEAKLAPADQPPTDTSTRVRIMASMGRAYADQLEDAQLRIEELLQQAPNNIDARYSLGNLYRYRGWEDRPFPEYNQALAMDPRLLPARTSYAYAKLESQQYPQAHTELRSVQPLYPGQLSVSDLNQEWLLYRSWQLIADIRWGESSGDTFGADQHEVNIWMFTEPIKDNYRLYLRTYDNYAEFSEGSDSRRRIATGAEYREDVWTARGEVNWNRTDSGDVGFAGRVDRRLNDEWTVGGELEIDSYATQLRADREDIKSNLYAADLNFVRDELYSAGVTAGFQDYDDGNLRFAAAANSQMRFYNGYTYKLDGLANLGLSSNSDGDDTVYFAPENDYEALAGVVNEWRQWRRYEKSLTHRVTALAGVYNQKSYGTDGIWTLAYQLDWSVNESIDLSAGVEESRRVYDGDSEDQTFFNARLNVRF
jgi:biofilm PGA synthesis protein PgaA